MTSWERRDLPLLIAAADPRNDQVKSGYFQIGDGQGSLALAIELSEEEIYRGLLLLRDAGYLEFTDQRSWGGPHATITKFAVTGSGMQMIGEWPQFERTVSPVTLAAFLERLADEAPTDEEAGAARAAANYVRGLAPSAVRAAAAGAVTAIARHALGF